jgi:hypothetical protein
MIADSLSRTFNSRMRLSILKADWRRIVKRMSAEELGRFPDNPLFAINAIAAEFGCELSSVGWGKSVEVRFVKHYGPNKVMWKVSVDRRLFADLPGLEALLRAMLLRQVAAANDRNTILQYFGPAAGN